jgi:RecA-family ATPase
MNRIERTAHEIFELEIVSALELLKRPAPSRQWCVEPWVPHREVTLLSGDGGIGKSTIALQLCTSAAARLDWFGMEVRHGAALYISCEDDIDEVHYRLEQIKAQTPDADFGQLHIVSLAGEPAFLATPAPAGMQPTARFKAIEKAIERHEIRLLVLDAAADVFGGNEIDRAQTRGFIQMLRGLAIRRNCAVILLAHPSVDAMKTGRGYAGSTAWNNSVRARLYFTRATAPDGSEPDQDRRLLELAKSNRGRAGQKIIMRWHAGCFVLDGAHETGLERLHKEIQAEQKFIELLQMFNEQGQTVSASRNHTFAPNLFAKHPAADGIGKKEFEHAMQRLLTADKIEIVEYGPPSRRYSKLRIKA